MSKNKGFARQVFLGAGFSVIFLLLGILIFAILLRFTPLSEKSIYPVNQFIKLFAAFFSVLVAVKEEKGFLKGLISGALGMFFCYLILSLFCGFALFKGVLLDVVFSAIIGGIAGVIKVNAKA